MRFLVILFIAIPIIEMWLLIVVGQHLGASLTIIMVVFTAVIGLHGLRSQGLSTLKRLQDKLSSQQLPAKEIVEGVILAIGCAFLLTPGFITDILGFSCLLPFTRKLWLKLLFTWFQFRLSPLHQAPFEPSGFDRSGPSVSGDTIEGEYSNNHDEVK